MIGTLHGAQVPILLGTSNAMRTLRYLPMRRAYWGRAATAPKPAVVEAQRVHDLVNADYMALQKALAASGIPVAEAILVSSDAEAVAAYERLRVPVAIKAAAPGLTHKSDIGCVRLNCASAAEVAQAYRDIADNARRAGVKRLQVIVQPMHAGVAEAYAGVIDDPQFGPAVCFGLGGVFVEIFKDVRTEMAPLSHDDALGMIRGIKGAPILFGARGRPKGDIDALADFLVRLGDFALAHAGRFAALDLNPIVVKPAGQGVVAVDIALEAKTAVPAGGSIAAPS
jgi:succinyl-CoA synthetase beta subunit